MRIGALDLGIVLAYFAAVVVYGLWVGGRQRSSADYMVGNRDLPWWAVMLSIVATETSTVTFLSVPGIVFADAGDFTFLQLPLGYIAGRALVVLLLLPLYFRGSFLTAYDVLHSRFGGTTKRLAALLFVVTRSLADGMRLFLSAIVLHAVSGIDMNLSIAVIGAITVVFTFFGGIRAVVWTDAVQFVVYMAGAGFALAVLLDKLDLGVAELVARYPAKTRIFDFDADLGRAFTFWAGTLGGTFVSLASHGADQLMVQRYLCARSQRAAGTALLGSGLLVLAQFAFFLLIGLGLHAYYRSHQPSVPFPETGAGDMAFARFIVDEIPPGALGIVLGAVFSAAISTLSSSINSLATSTVHDLLPKRIIAEDRSQLRLTRLLTIAFGAIQVAVGIAGQGLEKSVITTVLSIQSFTTGIVLGLFLLGGFVPRARGRHALAALCVGLAVTSYVNFATPIAWPWLAVVGSLTTLGVGVLATRLASGDTARR